MSASETSPFRPGVVIALVLIGIAAFAAIALTYSFRPAAEPAAASQGYALSNSAIGYSGIVRLVTATGKQGYVVRDDNDLGGSGLIVVTPLRIDAAVDEVVTRRRDQPTLIVLPKWQTMPDKDRKGWVDATGLRPPVEVAAMLPAAKGVAIERAPATGYLSPTGDMPFSIDIAAPATLQTIRAPGLSPLLTDKSGNVVLARLGDRPLYVLADPDILANLGMKDFRSAANAADMLAELSGGGPIGFDVTLVGLGTPPNVLRLAFEPPFLAMTLAMLIAVLLAAWQAFARFGPTARRERAIAFGKSALVDNSAALIAKARRQAKLGGRYADVIRDRARGAFGVPARLTGAAIDGYLDRLKGRARFSDLAQAADAARDRASLVAAARALHDWQKETSK